MDDEPDQERLGRVGTFEDQGDFSLDMLRAQERDGPSGHGIVLRISWEVYERSAIVSKAHQSADHDALQPVRHAD